jgi:hypothetical protein
MQLALNAEFFDPFTQRCPRDAGQFCGVGEDRLAD